MKSVSIGFSQKDSKKLNILGLRAAYGLTLFKLKKSNDMLSVFTADTSTSAGLDRFRNAYPDSFFDCGIAEQCMISTAAGYVEEGGTASGFYFCSISSFKICRAIKINSWLYEIAFNCYWIG